MDMEQERAWAAEPDASIPIVNALIAAAGPAADAEADPEPEAGG